jgi:tyrosine-protein phosphatase SIW14
MAVLIHIVFMSLSFCFAQSSQSQSAQKIIPNFSQVAPGIYRGGNPIDRGQGEDGISALKEVGINTIIDLQGRDYQDALGNWFAADFEPGELPENIQAEQQFASHQKIRFVHQPLSSLAPVSDEEDEQIKAVLEILKDSSQGPVFIHCEKGSDRTGLVVALFRVLQQGWTAEQAMAEWEKFGHTNISRYFTGDLDTYFYQAIKND